MLLAVLTRLDKVAREIERGRTDPARIRCDVYRCRNRLYTAISFLGETPLRDNSQAWRHVEEEAGAADECLAYALESLEYGEADSAITDLDRALENLRLVLFTIRSRTNLRYRSWPFDPWRNVAKRISAQDTAHA
jgi:hypothetical protein